MTTSKALPAWVNAVLDIAESALTADDQAAIVLLAPGAAPTVYSTCEFHKRADQTRRNALRTLVATANRVSGVSSGYVAVRSGGKIALFTATDTVMAQRVVSEVV